MELLKIRVQAPIAHFSIPFSVSERRTYPIPPFSTAIGLICNVLAKKEEIDKFLSSERLAMAITGSYEEMVTEYNWYRCFQKGSHKNRFGYIENRQINDEVEHIGGQMPMRVHTLHNAFFDVYVKSSREILTMIVNSFQQPQKWLSHLHAGRAEDVIENISVEIISADVGKVFRIDSYTWIPCPEDAYLADSNYAELFSRVQGTLHKIATVYSVKENNRVFGFVRAKLYSGGLPMVNLNPPELLNFQGEPIFLTKIGVIE